MEDSGERPPIIHLSDRRPTPRELPAFAGAPPPEPPPPDAFQAALEPLRSLEIGQALLLEQFIALVLPSLPHVPCTPVLERVRRPGDLSEEELRAVEARLGTYSRRVRQTPWLREHGHPLAVCFEGSGTSQGRVGDTGLTPQRHLFLLPDGQLGYVEALEWWRKREPGVSATALTPTGARRVTAHEAIRLFSLHPLLSALRALLWFEDATPPSSPDPELEARQRRFLEHVHALSQLAGEYNQRLWRLRFPSD